LTDQEPDAPEDPWLTLTEIAEELRMSPATIRSWISKGTLRAMLAGADIAGPDDAADASDWRTFDTIAPPHRSPHWTKPEALEHVSPGGWLGVAESAWRDALRASAQAPPDPGFIVRIKDIAEAAARKAAALDDLGEQEPGPWWQRQAALPGDVLSYELRPGSHRPGPAELWVRFDRAVDELGHAMAEHSVPAERQALEEVSLVLHDIVDALLEQEGRQWPSPPDEPDAGDTNSAEEPGDA
jgi:hypothetical protein